jgi:PTS system N-acetylglucosamine-specific IIC component
MALSDALGMRLGFGFSAGLFDYVLNFGKATRPLLLLIVGPAYALLYYGLFRFAIRRFDLPTPGRTAAEAVVQTDGAGQSDGQGRGALFIAALGGAGNLASIGACTTRLRLVIHDQAGIDEARLKALGARGIVRPSALTVQVVLGPIADAVADEMQVELATAGRVREPARSLDPASEPGETSTLPLILVQALGGPANIIASQRLDGRWSVERGTADAIIGADLDQTCDGWVMATENVAHIVTDRE